LEIYNFVISRGKEINFEYEIDLSKYFFVNFLSENNYYFFNKTVLRLMKYFAANTIFKITALCLKLSKKTLLFESY